MSVMPSRSSTLAVAAFVAAFALAPLSAHAQWWRSAPKDFEDCADLAEKAKTREDKTAQLADCNAKFAGRRKPGGGYTYYDFMQDRTFDIAGPNPTPEEQKKIDESYTSYLGNQRRSHLAAEAAAKQQQQQEQIQQVALRSTETERVPVPVERPKVQQQTQTTGSTDARPRPKNCAKNAFSCDWPRLSEGWNDLKKLFSTPSKSKQRS